MEPSPQSDSPSTADEIAAKNDRLGKVFLGVIVAMFLLGFASIPIYRMVCAKIDPGGSSWYTGDPDVYEGVEIDESREIRVRFATNVERQLPWQFSVAQSQVTVHPGERQLVEFTALNQASIPVTGKAVYDINPPEAAQYFKKIECFCFVEQTLEAGEKVEMPLYFWFEPDMPDHIKEITLAYTFFNADSSRSRSTETAQR